MLARRVADRRCMRTTCCARVGSGALGEERINMEDAGEYKGIAGSLLRKAHSTPMVLLFSCFGPVAE